MHSYIRRLRTGITRWLDKHPMLYGVCIVLILAFIIFDITLSTLRNLPDIDTPARLAVFQSVLNFWGMVIAAISVVIAAAQVSKPRKGRRANRKRSW